MTINKELVYKPAGPTLARFHASNAFVRLLMGPIGSAKSSACSQEIIWRAAEQAPGPDGIRHSRWAIIRQTFPELRLTTLKTFQDWTGGNGKWSMNPPMTWKLQDGELDVEVIFLALDDEADVKKLLSLELTGAWINEAREVPKAIFDALTGRVGRYPSVANGGCTWRGVILDTNPCADDHWLYKMFANEADRPEGFEFYRQPSGLSPQAENIQNLDPGYYRRIMAGKDPEWIKVYVHGDWGHLIEGAPVYHNFRDGTHVAAEPIHAVPDLPLYIGFDGGRTPAAVITQRLHDGRWLILDELTSEDTGAIRFSQHLAALVAMRYPDNRVACVYADPAAVAKSNNDDRTTIELVAEHTGWKVRPAPGNNDWTLRLEVALGAFGRLIDGRPGILISPTCEVLRKACNGGYHYRELRTSLSGLTHDETPAKTFPSHVAEALQYVLLGGGEGDVILNKVKRKERRATSGSSGSNYDLFAPDYGRSRGSRGDPKVLPYKYWKHDHA